MPTFPLPPIAPIDGGDLPVSDENDVLLILPAFLKPNDPPPVRNAIIAAIVAMMRKYQELASESAGMSDVFRSLDSALIGLGEDRGVFKQEGESNEDYRARILAIPDLVTPTAIIAAVNSILAPYTSIQAQYSESIQDRLYIGTSAPRDWHSYIWDDTSSMSPGYYDRLYEEYADQKLGYFRPNSAVGGARVYADAYGRMFVIRIPDIAGINALGAFPTSVIETPAGTVIDRFYIGGVGVSSSIRAIGTSVVDTFKLIVSTIYRLKGHSIRFMLLMDPKLKS